MSLSPRARLGSYEILSPLGAGGWDLARDERFPRTRSAPLRSPLSHQEIRRCVPSGEGQDRGRPLGSPPCRRRNSSRAGMARAVVEMTSSLAS